MNEEKKNKNVLLNLIIGLLIGAIISGGSVFLIMRGNAKNNNNSDTDKKEAANTIDNKKETEANTNNTNNNVEKPSTNQTTTQATTQTSNKQKCYGTYYVNGDKNSGVYILKEDGSYVVENKEEAGVFTINENTITFIIRKHTTGPRNEDPVFTDPKSYLISDDCSRIRLTDSGSHVSATLDKVN